MKKSLLIISLFFTSSLFSANTFVLNGTKNKVKAIIKYVSYFCDDVDVVLDPGSYTSFDKACCLKWVKFVGLEGPIKNVESSEIGGVATGMGISCGKDNRFRAKHTGGSILINERF